MMRYAGCSVSIAMSDRKPCIRCERAIDAQARSCPFCNWDQSQPVPPPEENINTAPAYVPPDDRPWRGKILAAVAFAALLIIAFVVGTFIHGFEPNEVKAAQKNATPQAPALTPAHRSDVTLVPVSGSGLPQTIEQPITSAATAGAGSAAQRCHGIAGGSVRCRGRTRESGTRSSKEKQSARRSAFDHRCGISGKREAETSRAKQ